MIEPAEPPHHHHHATGLPWFDLAVPLAVIAVSVASLLNALESERSMKALVEQNRRLVSAQSTPLLTYDTGNEENGKSVITMRISNAGTGPAEIVWFRATDAQGSDYTGSGLAARAARVQAPYVTSAGEFDTPAQRRRSPHFQLAQAHRQSGCVGGVGKAESRSLPPAPERVLLLYFR